MHSDSAATLDKPTVRRSLERHLLQATGIEPEAAEPKHWLYATAAFTRTLVLERWAIARRNKEKQGLKEACYFSMEFLIGRLLMDTLRSLGIHEVVQRIPARSRLRHRSGGGAGARCRPRQRGPRPPGGLPARQHGGGRRAGLRLWHPLRIRHVRPAHRRRLAERGAGPLAAPRRALGIPAPGPDLSGAVLRPDRRQPVGRDRRRAGDGVRRADSGLSHRYRQHAPAVVRSRAARARPAPLQRGRSPGRGRRQGALGKPDPRALSARRHRSGPRAAVPAAIFLRQRLAAGHPAAAEAAEAARRRTCRDFVAIQINDTHPGDLHRRADAAADGRAWDGLARTPGA